MIKIKTGYVQIYTGNGKGKTTAALGLALRASGAGLKVYIAQFLKMGNYSEIKALKKFSDIITIEQFGRKEFIFEEPLNEDIQVAQKGLERVKHVIGSGKYNVIILEEANVAVKYGLIKEDELLNLITSKPSDIELIITGRYASAKIINSADLVTEMKDIKHYYKKGVQARVGIEK